MRTAPIFFTLALAASARCTPETSPDPVSIASLQTEGDASAAPDASESAITQNEPGPETLHPAHFTSPIRHIIVVVKENRTFDSYFTGFPNADTTTIAELSNHHTITRPFAPMGEQQCGLPHGHPHALHALDDGAMDGFDRDFTCPQTPLEPFQRFHASELPAYWTYATHFALFDNFHSTVLGPSTPGHIATIAAQSPAYDNAFCPDSAPGCHGPFLGCLSDPQVRIPRYHPSSCAMFESFPCFDTPTVVDELPTDLNWETYGGVHGGEIDTPFEAIRRYGADVSIRRNHFRDIASLVSDVQGGHLANVVFAYTSGSVPDEAAPSDPCHGEQWTVDLVNAIQHSPYWRDTALLVTWDDWGGNFDHVAPDVGACSNGETFNPGFRLPLLLISAYARSGVVHTPTEQASIPKLIESLFGMRTLAARDPDARDLRAGSLLDGFDFTRAPLDPVEATARQCEPAGVLRCPEHTLLCDGSCSDVRNDADNCGACGHRCGASSACCNGTCMDVSFDSLNCGACGRRCPSDNPACNGGACRRG